MKATINPGHIQTKSSRHLDKKELVASMVLVGYLANLKELQILASSHIYHSRSGDGASPLFCKFRAGSRYDHVFTGLGKATGYGYHKSSAALHYAMQDAGVTLSEHIDGYGDAAMREALVAVAKAMYPKLKIYTIVEN